PSRGISDDAQTFRVGHGSNRVNEASAGWGGESTTPGEAAWSLSFSTSTRFMATGGQDPEPYEFTPVWSFTGDVVVQGSEITGVNLRTGALITRPVTYTLNNVKGECTGQSTYVNVGRGRGV
uniref:hypothetical protein n=1 Tax=Modestobacter sp. KNN46-3 TaxID=2711218 RepID=UPI0013DFA7FE